MSLSGSLALILQKQREKWGGDVGWDLVTWLISCKAKTETRFLTLKHNTFPTLSHRL